MIWESVSSQHWDWGRLCCFWKGIHFSGIPSRDYKYRPPNAVRFDVTAGHFNGGGFDCFYCPLGYERGIYIILCGEGLWEGRLTIICPVLLRGCKNGSFCRFSPQVGIVHRVVVQVTCLHIIRPKNSPEEWRDIIFILEKNSRLKVCCQDKRVVPEPVLSICFVSSWFPSVLHK